MNKRQKVKASDNYNFALVDFHSWSIRIWVILLTTKVE